MNRFSSNGKEVKINRFNKKKNSDITTKIFTRDKYLILESIIIIKFKFINYNLIL